MLTSEVAKIHGMSFPFSSCSWWLCNGIWTCKNERVRNCVVCRFFRPGVWRPDGSVEIVIYGTVSSATFL